MDTRVVSLLDQAVDMGGIPPGLIDDLAVQKEKATTRYASYRRLKNAVKKAIADRDRPVAVIDDSNYDVTDLGSGYASLEDINAPKKPTPKRPVPVEAVKKEDPVPADTPLDENGLPTELNNIIHDIYGDDIPDDVIQVIPLDDEQGEANGEYKRGHLDIAEPEPEPKRKPDWPIVVDDPDPGLKTEGNNEMTDTSKIHPSYYLRIRMYGDMFRGEHDGYTKSFRTPDECAIFHWNNRVVKDED